MRLGLVLPMATDDVGRVMAFARAAEEAGVQGLFAFDHLFPPGAPPERPSLEAYATLAAVARVTERIVLGTLVTRASLRPAGMLAKQAVTLDDVSGGRFVLGLGSGDDQSRAEHRTFGIASPEPGVRRQHLVETVRAVRSLFDGRAWPGGHHIPPIDGPLLPAPRTRGGPPIWIGGVSEGTVRVAAEEAAGWNGWGLSVEDFAARVRTLRGAAGTRSVDATWGGVAVIGRDEGDAERLVADRASRGLGHAWAGGVDRATAWLGDLRAAGAVWAVLLVAGASDRMGLIGERLVPAARVG